MGAVDEGTGGQRWLDEREQATWRAYLDLQAKLTARLNRDMQEASGISLQDFAVLAQVSEHPDGRVRVLELARFLGWEKSRVSHQLTRMQQRGLIARTNCESDRRGAWIVLTTVGRATVEQAAPKHVDSVRQYLFDALDPADVDALARIAGTVVDRVDAVCPDSAGAGAVVPVDPCGESTAERPVVG
jgi:DNA-binding MarR family transcriptional regulator